MASWANYLKLKPSFIGNAHFFAQWVHSSPLWMQEIMQLKIQFVGNLGPKHALLSRQNHSRSFPHSLEFTSKQCKHILYFLTSDASSSVTQHMLKVCVCMHLREWRRKTTALESKTTTEHYTALGQVKIGSLCRRNLGTKTLIKTPFICGLKAENFIHEAVIFL